MRQLSQGLAATLLAASIGLAVPAQDATATNPEAAKAFTEFLAGFRSHDAVEVKSKTTVSVSSAEAAAPGQTVEATMTYSMGKDRPRYATGTLRGFTFWSSGGQLSIIHESNPHAYFSMSDDDSPFYALMQSFVDLPFPDLALALGNESTEDVLMQLHPRAPMIQPTRVERIQKDGRTLEQFLLESADEHLTLVVDPSTQLPISLDAKITGGPFVQPGSSLHYEHKFDCTVLKPAPGESTYSFQPGERQRVDMLASLVKQSPREPANQDGEGLPEMPEGVGPLVGKPAPELKLPSLEGKNLDLVALKGQVVVVDFWATWCPPCRMALPELHKVASWAKDSRLPVGVITVNLEGNPNQDAVMTAVRKFWTSNKYTLPVAMDFSGTTAAAWGVNGIPATFVVRSDGVVHASHAGFSPTYAEDLKAEIKGAIEALEGKPAVGPGQ